MGIFEFAVQQTKLHHQLFKFFEEFTTEKEELFYIKERLILVIIK